MKGRHTVLATLLGACLVSACASVPAPLPAPAPAPAAAAAAAPEPATPAADGSLPPPVVAPSPEPPAAAAPALALPATGAAAVATGLDVYGSFIAGLAEPGCDNAEPRWLRHFAHATERVGDPDGDTLALFAHVVESLRAAGLPTEFALIPFVESGYAPGARSKAGPAGMWQFIAITARDHGVRVGPGYDERLLPAQSTHAAVQYLGTLYDRFDRNWRLALMAYNAGEFRVKKALVRSGGDPRQAAPGHLPGLSPVTYAYVEKLHALACLLEQAGERPPWLARLDRPVVRLQARRLDGARSLADWATEHGHDAAALRRINPGLGGRWPAGHAPLALVPDTSPGAAPAPIGAAGESSIGDDPARPAAATHRVQRGDSAWSIAKRYDMALNELLELNGLHARSVLRPGMVLKVR